MGTRGVLALDREDDRLCSLTIRKLTTCSDEGHVVAIASNFINESLWLWLGRKAQVKVIGSSDEVHTVDALATTGDEGRGSLR